MIRFAIGLTLLVCSILIGGYMFWDNTGKIERARYELEDTYSRQDDAGKLQQRIRTARRTAMVAGDDQKFTIERLLDIGAPGLEWRFVGTPRQYGSTRALYRHTFRIVGPTTYAESQEVMRKLVTLPGFVPYKYCFACTVAPKDTPPELQMVQIEGYLYVYDPNTLY
ncbi:MAG: hypothetical protein COY40_01280 [Alphaproteobacteria bacterium CG_4_10_14_0_8_um_filter_53_9]|nr:MAG: hypothetical protein COY40_01280 [Alphaproteobacteria bacterium CG_4_10_14_0_8_um_filter_53_9]